MLAYGPNTPYRPTSFFAEFQDDAATISVASSGGIWATKNAMNK